MATSDSPWPLSMQYNFFSFLIRFMNAVRTIITWRSKNAFRRKLASLRLFIVAPSCSRPAQGYSMHGQSYRASVPHPALQTHYVVASLPWVNGTNTIIMHEYVPRALDRFHCTCIQSKPKPCYPQATQACVSVCVFIVTERPADVCACPWERYVCAFM